MNKYLLPFIALLLLSSCRGALISDDTITIISKHTIHKKYVYKYFYQCRQNGLKVRIYSNRNYEVGQSLMIN